MNYGLKKKDINSIIKSLQKFSEVDEAILFGSRAMGNYKKASDIDISIKGNNVTYNTISSINIILNQELSLPYFFDNMNYEKITNKDLIQHIKKYGIVIYLKE